MIQLLFKIVIPVKINFSIFLFLFILLLFTMFNNNVQNKN